MNEKQELQNEQVNNSVEDQPKSREEKKTKSQGEKKPRIRLIPIWLRVIVVIVLLFISLAAGAMIGYGVIGEGDPQDVFHKETWQKIVDIVKKEK
ncbi:DNA-directed RNA polymerase subunit beta [Pseudalkalibacillus caeni]|uniref:DNA-directed RNA polymerase subunit beta n=1 Tax=Exobacillus caeni TaxID=2574798 RepID=A0A5R9EY79_9BACL|nr:DNA-directed RNA polymerase subunit beta [Pseudalkalibacillus caeni]TLS35801.1 DNA-directed RNA polymerase subunit beta [Pseudalkalibacillus caeni]